MSQLTYSQNQPAAIAGLIGDASDNHVVDSRASTDSTSIPFGVFVAQDSADAQGAKLPAGSTDKLLGVVLHAATYARSWSDANGTHGELDATGLIAGALLNVMRKGRVWVMVEEDVAIGDPVFVRYSANSPNLQLGAVRMSADSGHTIDMTSYASFRSAATAGGLAIVELSLVK